jgi:hypothetical protein
MDMATKRTTTLDALARAAVRIFRPLVRILLRHNVSYKTCADWLRWCYADVAYRDFALPNRKPTKSRVAVLTGLTRVDVNQLLAQPAPDEVAQRENYHRAALVLSGWANDPEFASGGKPLPALPFEAEDDDPSFSRLVAHHSGGAPARAVLDELERNGAVCVRADRSIELVRTRYITRAATSDIQTADIFGMSCGELIGTIDHNWRPEQPDKRLQLLVYNRNIDPDLKAEARTRIETAARELAEEIDALLYEHESRSRTDAEPEADADSGKTFQLGLGLYYFEADQDD